MNTYQNVMKMFRLDFPLEPRTHALMLWFEVAEELTYRDDKVPDRWKYRRGTKAPSTSEGREFYGLHELTSDELRRIGEVMERIVAFYERGE